MRKLIPAPINTFLAPDISISRLSSKIIPVPRLMAAITSTNVLPSQRAYSLISGVPSLAKSPAPKKIPIAKITSKIQVTVNTIFGFIKTPSIKVRKIFDSTMRFKFVAVFRLAMDKFAVNQKSLNETFV